ncbi:hypothetical protein FJ420_25035 [Mesorhizobium sp. B3-1-3]|uniref:hypothetical protein n=1 Tax=unclassified Mesorhizobium TaxID=325217 RepID=UPI001125BB17|nr:MULTISPECIES: hypothetical protein [unclassified Mesorhizobium]TPI61211.1 hypothetical protein FJ424_22925 [Mesorhizobium sp. B3-1-8]TPI66376.1 hypothetical protein FJ420_25035 [Mesorhizobium sp. B3-1-3]
MTFEGTTKEQRQKAAATILADMEELAARMRAIIAVQPPHDLLGYIQAQRVLKSMVASDEESQRDIEEGPGDVVNDTQFLLEYVHAVLASDSDVSEGAFDEAACVELAELGKKLRMQSIVHAMATSVDVKDGAFGPNTGELQFRAKSNWVMLRGNRYQVLEGEFFAYVLAPHDDMLRDAYGVGAGEIALGFRDMADAARAGHANAFDEVAKHFDAAQAYADERGKSFEDVAEDWAREHAEEMRVAALAMDNMVRGGTSNVSRHTKLPKELLADLAYRRGEDTEFFAPGPYTGTPYRTLPARKRPLIQLGEDYYAVDPCFARDAGYRALLWNLLNRKPEYKKTFEERQKTLGEAAFADLLSAQLRGATVHQEVYYRDPISKQWVENDTLILVDDVLFLVEAKAGAAATIASPALDFDRHAQAVQDLVIKAYQQCKRFFDYLNSADEVPIFSRTGKKYVERGRLRRAEYRAMFPIGLTVESFTPFSTYCKELPEIVPLLGQHAFISLSIDDLFVLRRFLPTLGEFAHYMEVRQAVAGIRGAHLFDELDHLGAYLSKNRFDMEIAEQQQGAQRPKLIIWDGMSEKVDRHFEGEDWETRPVPTQGYPDEVLRILDALDRTRAPGWLSGDSHIRNYAEESRVDLAQTLKKCSGTLSENPARYFLIAGDPPLFLWLQRADPLLTGR